MMDFESAKEIMKGANIGELIEKVKELPTYSSYEAAVNEGAPFEETKKILALTTMLHAISDNELDLLLSYVSHMMLFDAINMRLRSELGVVGE